MAVSLRLFVRFKIGQWGWDDALVFIAGVRCGLHDRILLSLTHIRYQPQQAPVLHVCVCYRIGKSLRNLY